jgi:SP family arabinose:H+ symporter-like MFS transporter
LGIVAGILSAVYINMLIEASGSETWNVEHGWRWMFAVGALPATLFGLSILSCEESPRWLMKAGQLGQARHVMSSIIGPDAANVEIENIRRSLSEEQGGMRELFAGPFRRALLVGFLLAALTQTSGITSLLSFLPEIFRSAGQKGADAFFQSVLVGIVNLAFTAVAIWLVDRAGRKTLILLGTGMQAFALAIVGLLYVAKQPGRGILVGIMAFVAGHAIGNGAVCWVIISEIFPTKVRGVAMSISTTALWGSAYLANQFFPLMQKYLGSSGTFFFFAGMAAVDFMFVLAFVPETRGYSLEEISRIWSRRTVS